MIISKHSVVVGKPASGLRILLGISSGSVPETKKKKFFRCCILFDGVFMSLHGFTLSPLMIGCCRENLSLGVEWTVRDVAEYIRNAFPKQQFVLENGREFSFVPKQPGPNPESSESSRPELWDCEEVPAVAARHFQNLLARKLKEKRQWNHCVR